jgi:hypothetical protein
VLLTASRPAVKTTQAADMGDTYFVEERSGVIGLGPLRHSPEMYMRSNKTNWRSSTAWIHLIICLLAIPLIIFNLYHLMATIIDYTHVSVAQTSLVAGEPAQPQLQYTAVHPLGLLIVLSAILMNLLGGVFALITEMACFSEKLAKFLYVMVYLSIAISIYVLVFSYRLMNALGLIVLFLFIICWGIGFWRFTIISAIYLNEEGPTWFKPLLYGCIAAIPLLTTSSQCRDSKYLYGCLPNDLFGGRWMFNDYFSFTLMTIIAVISSLPFLFGISHNEN